MITLSLVSHTNVGKTTLGSPFLDLALMVVVAIVVSVGIFAMFVIGGHEHDFLEPGLFLGAQEVRINALQHGRGPGIILAVEGFHGSYKRAVGREHPLIEFLGVNGPQHLSSFLLHSVGPAEGCFR